MTPEETIKAIVAIQNVSLNIMALIENACGIEFDDQGIAAQIIQTNIQDYAEQYHKDQSKWIDVNDRLPEKRCECLCYHGHWKLNIVHFDGEEFDSIGLLEDKPTHWQPLPEPPKE